MKKFICSAVCILVLGACSKQQTTQEDVSVVSEEVVSEASVSEIENTETLALLYQEAASVLMRLRPVNASSIGASQTLVGEYYVDKMDDYSPQTEAQLRETLYEISQKISAFPSASLEPQSHINKQVMSDIARYFSGDPAITIGYIDTWMGLSPFIVNQINGPIFDVIKNLQDGHAFTTEQDLDAYLKRVNAIDDMLKSVELKFLADAEQGWIAPKVLLQGALDYIDKATKISPENHGLVATLHQAHKQFDGLSVDTKQAQIDSLTTAITEVIYPAYESLQQVLESSLASAPSEAGIWAQPKGAEYYQDAIRQLGDTDKSADEIHQIGLDEVARISSQMDSILKQQGYARGSVGERMVALSKEPRFLYEDSDEGRATLLNDLNGLIDDITEKMDPYFKTKPKYAVEVRAFPKETQDSMPGGQYMPPPLDGSKPGIYWINLRDMQAAARFTLKTLTYHEANPGHHWQVSLNLAQDDLPFLRRIAPYNAFVEGWALYSEQIAYEIGMYENDPFGNLGRLQDELFRAVRLVVDTGLHHKKWTREQAIEYMMDKTGTPLSSSKAEIERYMAWPGQALGYKLGMLKILELREEAKQALGEQFDLAEFHDLILNGGAVPMSVLDAQVNTWVRKQLSSASIN